MNWIRHVICVVILTHLAECQYRPYDCRRSNSACQSSATCNRDQGTCACPLSSTTPLGYNCQPLAQVQPNSCSPACQNGGTCFRPNNVSAFRCFCPPQFTGPQCQFQRVRVTACSSTSMTAVIAPNSNNFQGSIYVRGHAGVSACRFVRSTDPAVPGYQQTLSLSTTTANPCSGPNSIATNTQNGVTSTTYTVRVQHSSGSLLTFTDEEHTLTCSGSATSASVTLGPVNQNGGTIGGTDVTGDSNQAFRLQITTVPNRVPPIGPVTVGQALYLQATPIDTANVPDFRITSCTATDDNVGQLVFLSNRCITQQGRESGVESITKVGNTMISLQFRAFKFIDTANVRISCQFLRCTTPNDPACALTTCAGNELNYGRRKREADSNNQTIPRSTVSLYVVSSLEELEEQLGKSCPVNTEEVCFHFATVAGVVSLFLFLLVIVLVMLVFVAVRLRNKSSKKELTAYTNNYADHQNM